MYKRKIIIAVALLTSCVVLLVTAGYAWLTLSSAPEVSGIETYVGANGNLEMALLNESTYLDPSLIKNFIGDSVSVSGSVVANQTWGNLIDLSDGSYGLQNINLLPSRLNVLMNADGKYSVGNNILVFPEYSTDGRFQSMITSAVSAVYRDETFLYSTQSHGYGVRGIGIIPSISLQQSSLVNARASLRAHAAASLSSAKTMWKANGDGILDIYIRHYVGGENIFNAADIALIRDTAVRMTNAISYIDLALRQSVIGYAATTVEDENEFKNIRTTVENTSIPLTLILESAGGTELPESMAEQVRSVDEDRYALQQVIAACDLLTGNQPWETVGSLVSILLNEDKTYLNDVRLSELNSNTQIGSDNVLSLIPGAGPMSTLTEFSGAYTVLFTYDSKKVEAESLTNRNEAYLVELADLLDEREAVNSGEAPSSAELTDIYGFALDFAFRCNTNSRLRLQTGAIDRVDKDETVGENTPTSGGGSFMTFRSDNLNEEQTVSLIDAVRIGFVDSKGTLLSVAKLGTTNYTVDADGSVRAPLYLYDFSVSVDGSISMGARREDNNDITELPRSEAVVITAVVWLDGDHVDNSLAAISEKNMSGALNLQFSSSAVLNPADISGGNNAEN